MFTCGTLSSADCGQAGSFNLQDVINARFNDKTCKIPWRMHAVLVHKTHMKNANKLVIKAYRK